MTSLELVRRIKARGKRGLIIATSPNFTRSNLWAERMCQTHGIVHMLGKDDGMRQLYAGLDQLIGAGLPAGDSAD